MMKSSKLRIFSIICIIIMALVCLPNEMEGRRRVSSKSTTSQSKSSSKKSSKKSSGKKTSSKSSSKKSTSKSNKSLSRRYFQNSSSSQTTIETENPADESVAIETPASRASVLKAEAKNLAKVESKRKIVVERPDLDKIRQETLDPKSRFYFPKLRAKYEANDTTMTPEEFRNFYLGYMFQEDFDPYRVSPYSAMTDELRQKPTHTREEIDTITKYTQLALQDNPFDLRQMSFLVHVLRERRKDMRAKIWEYRLENLLGAIKSTGKGDSTDDAWYVIYPSHEYDMVQLLGYEAVDAQFIDPGYDYLVVQPDESDTRKRDKSAKGFYFNVMVPQQQYELKHPEDMEGATEYNIGNPADDEDADDSVAIDDEEAE